MSRSHPRPEPRRQSSYLTFTPRRSAIASFDNLVVLANYEEHLREARKMVWRDRGEPSVDIHDINECLVHGARGALRMFPFHRPLAKFYPLSLYRCWYHRLCYPFRREPGLTIGTYQELVKVCLHSVFGRVATSSNLYPPREKRLPLIRHALFGSDSFRASAMLGPYHTPRVYIYPLIASTGSFVALYRIILNALPLLFPANLPLRTNLQNLFARLFSPEDESDIPFVDVSPSSSSETSPPQAQSLPYPLRISPGDRREARLSSSAQVHQSWVRKKTRRWHSVLAGAVAGAVAVSFEKRSRQTVIAQQLFVRYVLQAPPSIQGAYFLAVDCRVHTTHTRRNVVSTSHMERSWSLRSRTIDASLRVLRSDV